MTFGALSTLGVNVCIAAAVKRRRCRGDLKFLSITLNNPLSAKVDADFETLGMKTARPMHWLVCNEVMPLDAKSGVAEASMKRFPAVGDGSPSIPFAELGRGFSCTARLVCRATIAWLRTDVFRIFSL